MTTERILLLLWENVATDFGYNPDVAGKISLAIHFLFWGQGQKAGTVLSGFGRDALTP